jgi:hypothetical protein
VKDNRSTARVLLEDACMNIIDLEKLSGVHGGAPPSNNALVLGRLNQRYGDQGVVSFVGRPHSGASHNGVSHVTGKFDVNALWGGDTVRSFSANVNRGAGTVSGLHTRVIGSR